MKLSIDLLLDYIHKGKVIMVRPVNRYYKKVENLLYIRFLFLVGAKSPSLDHDKITKVANTTVETSKKVRNTTGSLVVDYGVSVGGCIIGVILVPLFSSQQFLFK
jgi:hypothetical protein